MPTGLSSRSQPCTSRFSRLRCRSPASGDGGVTLMRSFIPITLLVQIALDRRRSQKLLDPFCLVESLVDSKANLRCELEVNAPRDLAAHEFLVALERGDHLGLIAPAERHDIDGRDP